MKERGVATKGALLLIQPWPLSHHLSSGVRSSGLQPSDHPSDRLLPQESLPLSDLSLLLVQFFRLRLPTPISRPSHPMFDMDAITGFLDNGSGHSGSNQGSVGSFVAYTRQMCGAIFTHPNTGEKQFICLRAKSCHWQDHAVSLKGEQFGALCQVTRNPNNYYDGILSSEVNPEEYASSLKAARASNQEALRVLGQRPVARTGMQVGFNSPMTQIIDGRPTPALGLSTMPSTATASDEVFETSPQQEPDHIRSA
jgi:hypothetical protein